MSDALNILRKRCRFSRNDANAFIERKMLLVCDHAPCECELSAQEIISQVKDRIMGCGFVSCAVLRQIVERVCGGSNG